MAYEKRLRRHLKSLKRTLRANQSKALQKLTENGFQAIGLNGSDGGCLQADFIDQESLGFVGEMTEVNDKLITMLLQEGIIPVVTPIAVNKRGKN